MEQVLPTVAGKKDFNDSGTHNESIREVQANP